MTDIDTIGRVTAVDSTEIRVTLDLRATGFTKVGPDGLSTVGVVNSYVTVPAGAHRVVAIVTGVSITPGPPPRAGDELLHVAQAGDYQLRATIVGRFEGERFQSGMTGYPPLHAPVRVATPTEIKQIFLPPEGTAIRIGTSAATPEQEVHLDGNRLLSHHCAIVGSTGSGKSCTVLAVLDAMLERSIPGGHVVIFDINGEYRRAFSTGTARALHTRTVVLGPERGPDHGLFLPHWFMNNDEHLALFQASEGVQAPVLQRAIADARATTQDTAPDLLLADNIAYSVLGIERAFSDSNHGSKRAKEQLDGIATLAQAQAAGSGPLKEQWQDLARLTQVAATSANLSGAQWVPLTPKSRQHLIEYVTGARAVLASMLGSLHVGSGPAMHDFDAPTFYDLQQLCDFFLPDRVRREAAGDNKIAGYVATLQMRLSRMLADGRYAFMTRVEDHTDPLGAYLRMLFGADPVDGHNDWPGKEFWEQHASDYGAGPSVTIFDLSMVASDVLANVTALLGRLMFEFALRMDPRAAHPVLLVLEEAHRFVPARPEGATARSAAVFERVAKEGRKFGLSLLLASQRPSELSETVIAQCGTVIAHRLSHEGDQALLRHATAMSSRALLDQLPGLAKQHALVTGASSSVPVAVRIRDVADPPESSDPDFLAAWAKDPDNTLGRHIDAIAANWQAGGSPSAP